MQIELHCAISARQLFDKGASIELVTERLDESVNHSCTYNIPDNLDHLAKGGRLSPMAAKLGGLLRIKPILFLGPKTKGVIDPFDKVRTMSKAIQSVIDDMKTRNIDESYNITVVDVNSPEVLETTYNKLKETFPTCQITQTQLISTVSVHVGIGTIAFQVYKRVNTII